MNIETHIYSEQYRVQVMTLICEEYNRNINDYSKFYEKFYENNYQKDAIKVVAIEKESGKAVGFFALFIWPYFHDKKKFYSLKGVNAIVNPNYRGHGIFNKILTTIDDELKTQQADFLIATPLDAAFYGFLKNGWKHLVDLDWNIKITNPFAFIFPLNSSKIKAVLNEDKLPYLNRTDNNKIRLSDEADFLEWRAFFYRVKKYYTSYTKGENTIQFGLKLNIRKKIIRELIIGEVSTNSDDPEFIREGFLVLLKKIKKLNSITMVSIAVNPTDKRIVDNLTLLGFKKIKNKIHIVVKDLSKNDMLMNAENWHLFRGDLDSW